MDHCRLTPCKTNPYSPNENGDVAQPNYRFKKAGAQAFLLQGHRNSKDRKEYEGFLSKLFRQLNAGRKDRLTEELEVLHRLPKRRIDSWKKLDLKVGPGCTIRVNHNVYSVSSRLIGEKIQIRLYMEKSGTGRKRSIPCHGYGMRGNTKLITGISLTVWSESQGRLRIKRCHVSHQPFSDCL